MIQLSQIVSLWDMLKVVAPNLSTSIFNLGLMSEKLVNQAEFAKQEDSHSIILSAEMHKGIILTIHGLLNVVDSLEMPVTKAAVGRLIEQLPAFKNYGDGEFSLAIEKSQRIGWLMASISTAFTDELSGVSFYKIRPMMAALLEEDISAFDYAVSDCFPNAIEDIVEAGKCLALGRSTASVFHLMRAMEISVQAMAAHLEIEKIEKVWGNLLSDIDRSIKAMPKGAEKDDWSAAHSHLYHVKQAWRNKTMHPKMTYTDTEAKRVYDAVASFMSHLAPLISQT